MQPLTVTKREIEQLGGPSADMLSRPWQRARLETQGFPAPVPGLQRPLRWSRLAVERWLNQSQAPASPADDSVLLAERLAARSRALAAGGE
jgi:hypothetical protein